MTFTIYPAIDVLEGRCVRLAGGDRAKVTIEAGDPIQAASRFASEGARFIHLVDLDGAFSGKPSLDLVREIVEAAGEVPVQVGGGYRTMAAVEAAITAGAERVIVGTAAISPAFLELAANAFGKRLLIAIDARDGRVAVRGWTELSELDAAALARACAEAGVRRLLVTSTRRDGSLAGPELGLLRDCLAASQLPVIAAGGIASIADLIAVRDIGCEGAIAGSALWMGRFTIAEAERSLATQTAGESP